MATLKYANPSSGPAAGGIGWIDWGDLVLAPGETITGLSVTLLDDAIMTFDITNTTLSGSGFTFTSISTPTFVGAPFGTDGYTDIDGKIALEPFMDYVVTGNSARITINNISVTEDNTPVYNFTLISANVETEDGDGDITKESQTYVTNISTWTQLTWLGNILSPSISGLYTDTCTMAGTEPNSGAPVIYCEKTDSVYVDVVSETGFQAVAFGITTTSIRLRTYITKRIHPSDQFVLTITGVPTSTATTTGSATGLQSEIAWVDGFAGSSYTINESMAPGSVSLLSDYNQTVIWTQVTPGGSAPPTPGALGDTVTLALADVFICDIVNVPKTPSRGINLFNFED